MNAKCSPVTRTSSTLLWMPLGLCTALLSLSACGGEVFSTGDADSAGDSDADGSTGGSTSAGGSAATGGSTSGGGSTGTGGAGGCATGMLKFVVTTQTPGASCLPDCGQLAPFIRGEFGDELRVTSQCTTSCEQCAPIACALAPCSGGSYFQQEASFVWDGTTYVSSTCGGNGFSCDQAACSVPGQYSAQFCVPRAVDSTDSYCASSGEKDCKTVNFTWPTNETIEVDLSVRDLP